MSRALGRSEGPAPDRLEPGSAPEAIRDDLVAWAEHVMGADGLVPAAHHRLLMARLQAVSEGTIDRLMVLMPPGAAKSTYSSVNTDLWGAFVPIPATAGTWYAWCEGSDGSTPTVYATPFTVT